MILELFGILFAIIFGLISGVIQLLLFIPALIVQYVKQNKKRK